METRTPRPETVLQNVITYFCFKAKTLSQTKLMKLVYLADVYHMKMFGTRLTNAPFKHWYYGPWSEMVDSEIEQLCGIGVIREVPYTTRSGHRAEVPRPNIEEATIRLPQSGFAVLEAVIAEWGAASSEQVIHYAKTMPPFHGTPFGEEIDFTVLEEFPMEKGMSIEEATGLAGSDLATRMAQDKGFIQGTERGLAEIEQGRYSRIEDIKKKLGDL